MLKLLHLLLYSLLVHYTNVYSWALTISDIFFLPFEFEELDNLPFTLDEFSASQFVIFVLFSTIYCLLFVFVEFILFSIYLYISYLITFIFFFFIGPFYFVNDYLQYAALLFATNPDGDYWYVYNLAFLFYYYTAAKKVPLNVYNHDEKNNYTTYFIAYAYSALFVIFVLASYFFLIQVPFERDPFFCSICVVNICSFLFILLHNLTFNYVIPVEILDLKYLTIKKIRVRHFLPNNFNSILFYSLVTLSVIPSIYFILQNFEEYSLRAHFHFVCFLIMSVSSILCLVYCFSSIILYEKDYFYLFYLFIISLLFFFILHIYIMLFLEDLLLDNPIFNEDIGVVTLLPSEFFLIKDLTDIANTECAVNGLRYFIIIIKMYFSNNLKLPLDFTFLSSSLILFLYDSFDLLGSYVDGTIIHFTVLFLKWVNLNPLNVSYHMALFVFISIISVAIVVRLLTIIYHTMILTFLILFIIYYTITLFYTIEDFFVNDLLGFLQFNTTNLYLIKFFVFILLYIWPSRVLFRTFEKHKEQYIEFVESCNSTKFEELPKKNYRRIIFHEVSEVVFQFYIFTHFFVIFIIIIYFDFGFNNPALPDPVDFTLTFCFSLTFLFASLYIYIYLLQKLEFNKQHSYSLMAPKYDAATADWNGWKRQFGALFHPLEKDCNIQILNSESERNIKLVYKRFAPRKEDSFIVLISLLLLLTLCYFYFISQNTKVCFHNICIIVSLYAFLLLYCSLIIFQFAPKLDKIFLSYVILLIVISSLLWYGYSIFYMAEIIIENCSTVIIDKHTEFVLYNFLYDEDITDFNNEDTFTLLLHISSFIFF